MLAKIFNLLRIGGKFILIDLMESEEKLSPEDSRIHSEIHEYGAFCNCYQPQEIIRNFTEAGFQDVFQQPLGIKKGLSHYLATGTKV